jgi:hydroxyacylglutathione hydrolase
VKTFVVGLFSANCYVVSCKETLSSVIIDPGFGSKLEAEEVFSYIVNNGLKVELIVCTHGHPDHTSGNELVKRRFEVPICIHENDAYMLGESGRATAKFFGYNEVSPPAESLLQDGDLVEIGNEFLKVLFTPGHSPGSITLLSERVLFSGDTLFAGSIGRTDFPGSSNSQMLDSLKKLIRLPSLSLVYPGHGSETTMEVERQSNPFLSDL